MSGRTRFIAVAGGALLLLAVLGATGGRPALTAWLSRTQPLPVGGRLLLPSERGLLVFDLDQQRESSLLTAGAGQIVSAAAWSPDRQRVVYGFFHRRPGDSASVSEIYLAGADGSNPKVLAERDGPGNVLDNPVWSPDGRDVYFSYFGQAGGRPAQRIERVNVASGERQAMVENGYSPASSPDGQRLLFLRDERAGSGLWSTALGEGGPTAVLPPGKYPALAVPRFSPDGQRLAVAIMNVNTAERRNQGLLSWLLPSTAYAHGQPWDIWTFDTSGGEPRRLTRLDADDPSPVWSPDGSHIALWGGGGLWIVSADGSRLVQVLDRGSYGPIDWAR